MLGDLVLESLTPSVNAPLPVGAPPPPPLQHDNFPPSSSSSLFTCGTGDWNLFVITIFIATSFFFFSIFFFYTIFLLGKNSFLHWLKTIFSKFLSNQNMQKLAPKQFTDYNTSQVVRGLQLPSLKKIQSVLQLCKQMYSNVCWKFKPITVSCCWDDANTLCVCKGMEELHNLKNIMVLTYV